MSIIMIVSQHVGSGISHSVLTHDSEYELNKTKSRAKYISMVNHMTEEDEWKHS